jgi:hypothetical protein
LLHFFLERRWRMRRKRLMKSRYRLTAASTYSSGLSCHRRMYTAHAHAHHHHMTMVSTHDITIIIVKETKKGN